MLDIVSSPFSVPLLLPFLCLVTLFCAFVALLRAFVFSLFGNFVVSLFGAIVVTLFGAFVISLFGAFVVVWRRRPLKTSKQNCEPKLKLKNFVALRRAFVVSLFGNFVVSLFGAIAVALFGNFVVSLFGAIVVTLFGAFVISLFGAFVVVWRRRPLKTSKQNCVPKLELKNFVALRRAFVFSLFGNFVVSLFGAIVAALLGAFVISLFGAFVVVWWRMPLKTSKQNCEPKLESENKKAAYAHTYPFIIIQEKCLPLFLMQHYWTLAKFQKWWL
jgi:predicted lipid-binding transport protein (Tim44 family)